MPGMIRPSKKLMRIAYKILKTPKDQQQKNEKRAPLEKVREWFRDSSFSSQKEFIMAKKKITVARGVTIFLGKEEKMRKKNGIGLKLSFQMQNFGMKKN